MMISLSRIALSLGALLIAITDTNTIVQGAEDTTTLPGSSPNQENLSPDRKGACPLISQIDGSDCSKTGGFTTCKWGEMDTTGCEYECRCNENENVCSFRTVGSTECSGVTTMSKDNTDTDVDVTLSVDSSGPMSSSIGGGGGIVSTAAAAVAIATFTAFAL